MATQKRTSSSELSELPQLPLLLKRNLLSQLTVLLDFFLKVRPQFWGSQSSSFFLRRRELIATPGRRLKKNPVILAPIGAEVLIWKIIRV